MRRSLLAIGIGTGTALAIVAACTFPDVTFNDGTGGPETGMETSTQEAGTDAPTDTATPDVAMVDEAGMAIDAAACDDATCDCDGDGFFDINKRSLACDAGADAKYDCDDLVKSRNPGNQQYFDRLTETGAPPPGDWNCNGTLELSVDTNLKCKTGLLDCGGSGTDQHPKAGVDAKGFLTDVKCGEKALLYTCAFNGTACVPQQSMETTQGCR